MMKWKLIEIGDDIPKLTVADEDNVSILTIVYEDETPYAAVYDPAHARLIAAAPKILEVLKEIRNDMIEGDA